jgi:hypothetical protein
MFTSPHAELHGELDKGWHKKPWKGFQNSQGFFRFFIGLPPVVVQRSSVSFHILLLFLIDQQLKYVIGLS